MHLGIDLDNTLICYDVLFHTVAVEQGLVAPGIAPTKQEVKNEILRNHSNWHWTRLQAEVYGPRIFSAIPFPGVAEFIRECQAHGYRLSILSHKTKFAALDGSCNLRRTALQWLEKQGWFTPGERGLSADRVYFFNTRLEKIRAIRDLGCDVFIDDLVEIFQDFAYPSEVRGFWFNPDGASTAKPPAHTEIIPSWPALHQRLLSSLVA